MAKMQTGVGEPGTEFCLWPGAAYIGAGHTALGGALTEVPREPSRSS